MDCLSSLHPRDLYCHFRFAVLVALEQIALAMHKDTAITITRNAAIEVIGEEPIFDALLANGLLMGEDVYRFAPHQTVQEHFAARALKAAIKEKLGTKGLGDRFAQTFLKRDPLDYAKDDWWAETFIQVAGLTDDPSALAGAVADINPWLALWCVEEGNKVDEATRMAIEERSVALVGSPDVGKRRLVAQTLSRLNSPRVIDPLVRLAADADDETSNIAASGVTKFGDAAIPISLDLLQGKGIGAHGRAKIGRLLSGLGDPRRGVGLRADGLPDIFWCEVLGGGFIFQNGEKPMMLPTFKIAKYPITYKQFQAFIDAPDGFKNEDWWRGLHTDGLEQQRGGPGKQDFKFGNHPCENVSWYEAMAFCAWLSAKLGYEIRLPTEPEWEKAARGTDGRAYPYEGDFDAEKGNTSETGIGQTSTVGIFPGGASPYEVLDMSGNVWEWTVTDYYHPEANDMSAAVPRVLRAGSWLYDMYNARTSNRDMYYPHSRFRDYGFRGVHSIPVS